jgi:predicted nucleotidyltransferase
MGSRGILGVAAAFGRVAAKISEMSILERLASLLGRFPAIRLAVVYGSAARGEETSRSDIDLAVLLDEDAAGDALWEIDCDVGAALHRPVDLVDLRRVPPLLGFEIAREGVVLVEREPGLWAEVKARSMLRWWDWAPTARMIHRVAAERLRQEIHDGPG